MAKKDVMNEIYVMYEIDHVLVTLPLSDLQGYEDALPLSLVARISID